MASVKQLHTSRRIGSVRDVELTGWFYSSVNGGSSQPLRGTAIAIGNGATSGSNRKKLTMKEKENERGYFAE
jgi:hypothetical protein